MKPKTSQAKMKRGPSAKDFMKQNMAYINEYYSRPQDKKRAGLQQNQIRNNSVLGPNHATGNQITELRY